MAEDRGVAGGTAGEAPADVEAPDALDAHIDYECIAARSEADRAAGRLVPHGEVERQVEVWLRDLAAQRRTA